MAGTLRSTSLLKRVPGFPVIELVATEVAAIEIDCGLSGIKISLGQQINAGRLVADV